MQTYLGLAARLAGLLFFIGIPLFSQTADTTTGKCLRCHGLSTLGVRDSALGGIRNLSVNPERYAHSTHRNLSCEHCHTTGYASWPHAMDRSAVAALKCENCHEDAREPERIKLFKNVEAEFAASIHRQKLGDKFTCFACHEPHVFERRKEVNEAKIEAANGMCLQCHSAETRFAALTKRAMLALEESHSWLPNQDLHRSTVRCVDCHSSYNPPNVSHNILPKEKALKDCERCHTQNSALLSKLYKYERKKTAEELGFVNATLLNDAYVIGTTRHPLLDTVSVILFGLTILGVGGHGFLRYRAKKNGGTKSASKRQNDSQTELYNNTKAEAGRPESWESGQEENA